MIFHFGILVITCISFCPNNTCPIRMSSTYFQLTDNITFTFMKCNFTMLYLDKWGIVNIIKEQVILNMIKISWLLHKLLGCLGSNFCLNSPETQ